MAAATGIPVDLIRKTWALHQSGRRAPIDVSPVAPGEELPPTNRVGNVESVRPAKEPHERKVHKDKPRAAARMLELLDETSTDLSDEALRGAWRDGGRG